jgi:hypothetical protein
MNDWPRPILLDSPEECEKELMRSTNGLASLDHIFTLAVDARDEADEAWEAFEAKASAEVAQKGITATELRGRITTWTSERPDAMAARRAQRLAHSELEKIARYYRSAEQRATNAQAALKRHLGNARYGGTT